MNFLGLPSDLLDGELHDAGSPAVHLSHHCNPGSQPVPGIKQTLDNIFVCGMGKGTKWLDEGHVDTQSSRLPGNTRGLCYPKDQGFPLSDSIRINAPALAFVFISL